MILTQDFFGSIVIFIWWIRYDSLTWSIVDFQWMKEDWKKHVFPKLWFSADESYGRIWIKVTKQRNPMKYTRENSDGTGAFQMFFLFPIKHFQVQNVRFRKAKESLKPLLLKRRRRLPKLVQKKPWNTFCMVPNLCFFLSWAMDILSNQSKSYIKCHNYIKHFL